MRSVAHLMGVEFIHDLYNRHEPKINSIRFRHTITVWKDGIVNSYAPVHEWSRLGEILGDQYYSLDPLLINSTKTLYQRKREYFHTFIKKLQQTKFRELSNEELASLLIHFQSIVLGELYVLNFVQVEHGLNIAVKKVIREIEPDKEKAENLFVRLIQTKEPSASQKEKTELYKIARKWEWLKKLDFSTNRGLEKMSSDIMKNTNIYTQLMVKTQPNLKFFGPTFKSFCRVKFNRRNEPLSQNFFTENQEIYCGN